MITRNISVAKRDGRKRVTSDNWWEDGGMGFNGEGSEPYPQAALHFPKTCHCILNNQWLWLTGAFCVRGIHYVRYFT